MTETTQRILEEIAAFQQELQTREKKEGKEITQEEYVLLLSGLSSCRMMPGMPEHMGYETLKFAPDEESRKQGREWFARLYGIESKEDLQPAVQSFYNVDREYDQFRSFWEGNPVFDENTLSPEGKASFTCSKEYAALFRPFVADTGFEAWDVNEKIGLYRKACACGIITGQDFWELTLPLAKGISNRFHSWEEYAMSCLCGCIYFMFRGEDCDEDAVVNIYRNNKNMLDHLFAPGGAWERSGWYTFPTKNWAIPASEIKELLTDWEGPAGCIVTDRILVDGCKVGYMYREEPDGERPDSGWRFCAGDESEEYMNNPSNSGIYHLNTVCNSDPDIIPLLNAPYGTAYIRDEDGNLVEDIYDDDEE